MEIYTCHLNGYTEPLFEPTLQLNQISTIHPNNFQNSDRHSFVPDNGAELFLLCHTECQQEHPDPVHEGQKVNWLLIPT